MKRLTRREAVRAIGVTAVAPAVGAAAARSEPQASGPPLTTAALEPIAEAVLPAAMGAEARRRVVSDFLRWVKGYREGTETDHGYGVTRIRVTGPSPAARYPAQLAALDAAAASSGSGRFRDLSVNARCAIIEAALTAAKIERLPGRPSGGHIAADLMAFYFNSAAAFDLAYRAHIGRDTCRGLDGSEKEPTA